MTTAQLQLPISSDDLANLLRQSGVQQAYVFGSYARGEQTKDSDLDLFIHCKPGVNLFDVFRLRSTLEQATGVSVDLVTKLNPHFAPYIEPELVELPL